MGILLETKLVIENGCHGYKGPASSQTKGSAGVWLYGPVHRMGPGKHPIIDRMLHTSTPSVSPAVQSDHKNPHPSSLFQNSSSSSELLPLLFRTPPPPLQNSSSSSSELLLLFRTPPPPPPLQNSSSSSAVWELSRGPRSSGRDRSIRCHRLGGQMM